MKREQRWNQLAPRWNQLAPHAVGAPMPLQAKLSERWRQNAMKELKARGTSTEAERAVDVRLMSVVLEKAALSGNNVTAELLLRFAEILAVPGRGGRPPGSSTHNDADLKRLMTIRSLDDGSRGAVSKAIAKVLESEGMPNHLRPAAEHRLRRKLDADKN